MVYVTYNSYYNIVSLGLIVSCTDGPVDGSSPPPSSFLLLVDMTTPKSVISTVGEVGREEEVCSSLIEEGVMTCIVNGVDPVSISSSTSPCLRTKYINTCMREREIER